MTMTDASRNPADTGRRSTTPIRARLATLAVALMSTVALLATTASAASADYNARFQTLIVDHYRDGTVISPCLNPMPNWIDMEACDNGDLVTWTVHQWRDGSVQLRALGTNSCLDDSDAGLRTFTPCWPGSSEFSAYQSWNRTYYPDDNGSGATYVFRNQATGRCLDYSSIGIRTFACNGLAYQRWRELL